MAKHIFSFYNLLEYGEINSHNGTKSKEGVNKFGKTRDMQYIRR